ncbi:hypothetical protein LOTGIDRAFT_234908 [Lottia gigantea]|uniref:Uncharacterized protein n=1 Tax=Lottia gigantea TaxID=225164 RepID=V3Z9P3_LOTGI|nr:hypothetical protein LOTGIDRAFT_234908 [Lottia gigantea]ESO87653.1 hypothetical protein LOTGIDRAFT_234908 [Lottia gigantea]
MTTTERRKLQDLRVCRVFFSSPFGGMEVEREILTRKYFPQIHHLCNSHGVQFVPVDMRWGITKEAGENAQVINICLRELDRSDMFVGFFGQRYGWHGKEDKLLQQNFDNAMGRYPWIDEYRHHSVTAVEFMHGHLNNPGLHPACFAFRNKDYDDKLKEEGLKRDDKVQVYKYSSESDYANKMLEGLKQDIIKSKDKLLGVHVDYNDPEEGARLLFETIWKYMTKELLVRDEELTESMRQLAEHNAYLSARTSIYLQGDEYIIRLDDALNSNDAPPFIVLGEVGSGKSALLSNWINNHKSDDNDNVIWLYHFVGAASGSTAPKQILSRIVNDLKSVIEGEKEKINKPGDKENQPEDEGDGVWKMLEKLNLLLRKATHSEKKVVIVIDGLNKIQQAKKIMKAYYWVPKPKDLPQGVFMVVSTTSNDQAAHDVFVVQEKFHVLKIQPLEEETKKELCVKSLKESGKELSPHQLQKILDARLTNNPLYLMIVLWELSVFGSFRLLDSKLDSLLQAESVSGLFVKYLERLEEDYNTDETGDQFVQQVMSGMILSNKGISENEIQAVFNITSHGWSPLNFALEKFTISHFGLLKLGFIELHQAVEKRYLNNNPSFKKMMCEKLMKYFEERRKELGSLGQANLRGNSALDRIANELPYLQKLLDDKTGLLRTIVDIHIFHNIIRQERYELLDLVYFTGFKLDKIACEFLKSFDQHIANVYIRRLETEKEWTKSPGEACMYNLRNMGIVMELAGNFKGYEIISLRTIQLLENLEGKMDEVKRSTELMEARYYMACNYADAEKYTEAVDLHNKVIDFLTKISKEKTLTKDQRQVLAFATHGIGVVYLKKKDLEPCRKYLEDSVKIHEENDDENKKRHIAEANINIGLVDLYSRNYDAAIEKFQSSLKAYEEIYFGQQPHELGNLYTNIGLAYRRKSDYDMAEQMYRKSLVIKANAVGWDNPVIAVTYMNLGTLQMFRKDYEKAREYNQKCIDVIEKNHRSEEDMYYRMALENIVQSYVKEERFHDALPVYRRMFDILVRLNQMNNCLPGAHRAMIKYLIQKGELTEAEEKTIEFLKSSKSKPDDVLLLHSIDIEKPSDQRPKRPYKMTLQYALDQKPDNVLVREAFLQRDCLNNDKIIDENLINLFETHKSDEKWKKVIYEFVLEHDREDLFSKLEKMEGKEKEAENPESMNITI